MKAPRLATLLGLVLVFSSARPFDPDNGLVAYYSFNECDATDDSGKGSDGRIYGQTTCHCGIDENGLLLDGRSAYIEFPGPVNRCFSTTDFSLSFYFRPMQFGPLPQSLLSKRGDCGEDFLLDLHFNAPQSIVETEFRESAYKYYHDLSPSLDTTSWIHFALVREGTIAYTYINGALRNRENRCSGMDISNEALLSFSHSPCISEGMSLPFRGVIDELKVFDRALSEQEIADLYSLHPVEQAEQDCLVFGEEKFQNGCPYPPQSPYLCHPKKTNHAG